MRALLLLITLILAGCGSPAERAAEEARNDARMEAQVLADIADAQALCRSFGFQDQTPPFRQCVYEQASNAINARYDARAASTPPPAIYIPQPGSGYAAPAYPPAATCTIPPPIGGQTQIITCR